MAQCPLFPYSIGKTPQKTHTGCLIMNLSHLTNKI